jgi:hypothetical protein
LALASFKVQRGPEFMNLDTLDPKVESLKLNPFCSGTSTKKNSINAIETPFRSEMASSLLPVTKTIQNGNCSLATYIQEHLPSSASSSTFSKTSSLSSPSNTLADLSSLSPPVLTKNHKDKPSFQDTKEQVSISSMVLSAPSFSLFSKSFENQLIMQSPTQFQINHPQFRFPQPNLLSRTSPDLINNTSASLWKNNSNVVYDCFKTPKRSVSALNFSQSHTNMPFNGDVSGSSRMLITMLHSSPSATFLGKVDWDWPRQQQTKFAPTQLPSRVETCKSHSFQYPLSQVSSSFTNGSMKRKFHQAFVPKNYMSPRKKVRKSRFIKYSFSGNNENHKSFATYPQSSVVQSSSSKAMINLTASHPSPQKTSAFYVPDELSNASASSFEMVWDHKLPGSNPLDGSTLFDLPLVDKVGKSPLVSENVYPSQHQKPYALQNAPSTSFLLSENLPNNRQRLINLEREPIVLPLASAEFDIQYSIQQPFTFPVIFRSLQQHVSNNCIKDKNNVFSIPASLENSSKPTKMASSAILYDSNQIAAASIKAAAVAVAIVKGHLEHSTQRKIQSSDKIKAGFRTEQQQQVISNEIAVLRPGREVPIEFYGAMNFGRGESASITSDLQNSTRESKRIPSDDGSHQQAESNDLDKRQQYQAMNSSQTQLLPIATFVENNKKVSIPKKNANLPISLAFSPRVSSRSSTGLVEKQFQKGLSSSNVLATPETPSQNSSFSFKEYLNIYTPSPHNNVAAGFESDNTDRKFFDSPTGGYSDLSRFDFESEMTATTNSKSILTTRSYTRRRISSADLFKESALLYQSRMCIDGSRVNGTDLAGEYLNACIAKPMSTH